MTGTSAAPTRPCDKSSADRAGALSRMISTLPRASHRGTTIQAARCSNSSRLKCGEFASDEQVLVFVALAHDFLSVRAGREDLYVVVPGRSGQAQRRVSYPRPCRRASLQLLCDKRLSRPRENGNTGASATRFTVLLDIELTLLALLLVLYFHALSVRGHKSCLQMAFGLSS